MAMMAKMRSLAPWFIISVGGLFILFMVLSDSRITQIIGMRSNNVGTINGQDVTYQQFTSMVDRLRTQQEKQNGVQIEESQMDAFRDQVWDLLVSQTLLQQKIKELGIEISDDEIRETILGDNPPDFLQRNFIDSTGNFNRAQYESAIFDPRNKDILIQVEDQIRAQKIQAKLQSLVNASVSVSEDEIRTNYIDNNTKMSSVYVMVDANTIPDSMITVTEEDLQNYYDENIEDFKIEAQRRLRYVLFEKKPSKGDTLGIINNLNSIIEKLKGDTSTFKTYVEIYSDEDYSLDTVSIPSLPGKAVEQLLTAEKGAFVGPVLAGQNYVVYRLDDVINTDETFVHASHILIRSQSNNEDSLKTKAEEIYQRIRNGESFEELAKKYSEDPGSASKGGDLGWFGKGAMVKEFENAAFGGKIGEVIKPIKTRFGYHIIKVTARSNKKFVIEKIVNKIQPSPTTVDKIYNRASDFSYLAKETSFEREANLMKYVISETPPFTKNSTSIPGLGSNRAMIQFAFDNSVGDVSEVFRVPAGYVVAIVSEEIDEGYKSLDEVRATIERTVKHQKKLDATFDIAQRIYEKIGDSENLNIAKSVYPKAKISAATNYSPNGNVTGIGLDYAFNQYSLKAEMNKISPPVKGKRGSYLIKVTRRTEFNQADYEKKRPQIQAQLLSRKKANAFKQWLDSLREEADIVDNRHQFFR